MQEFERKLERFVVAVDFDGSTNYLTAFEENGIIFSKELENAKIFHRNKAIELAKAESRHRKAWIVNLNEVFYVEVA